MAQSYFAEGLAGERATFSLFFRTLPPRWGYLLAAGLDDALGWLERLRFTDADLAYLEETTLFTAAFLGFLGGLSFTGEVRALPEGTAFFPHEPALEVTAPLVEAQLAETLLVNQVHLQSLLATKAARCVDAARGRRLIDFGVRRAHGVEAGMRLARCAWIAGFDATSNVAAGRDYGIPVAGTMAHSYVQSFPDEVEAFRAFARAYPDRTILLVDTYDTPEGVRRAAAVGLELARGGHRLAGVRLDSGDLLALSREARAILDGAGLDAEIYASSNLDEDELDALLAAGAPIDGFGVGSRLAVSSKAPYLDMVYKLVDLDGHPSRKLSSGKVTLPGCKQVWRLRDADGAFAGDVLALADEEPPPDAEPLLRDAIAAGTERSGEPLDAVRARALEQRTSLPAAHRALDAEPYPVRLSAGLDALRHSLSSEPSPPATA
jgi:nicotinate phosphoribosyltransferase